MSLSLSSLLNPSDEKEAPCSSSSPQENRQPNHVDAPLQAVSHVTSSPTLLEPAAGSYSPNTTHEAAQALAALSDSPVATHAQWHGSAHQDQGQMDRRLSTERRPGSGYAESIQLPPPPPQSDATRKMSSPTLEQYQVASRSPEQRRASLVSPTTQSNITLPPLQGFTAPQAQDLGLHAVNVSHEFNPTPSSHASAAHAPAAQSPFSSMPTIDNTRAAATPPALLSTSVPSGRLKPEDDRGSSPAVIKQEKMPTPQPLSPSDARRASDVDQQTSKAVSSLKSDHVARTHSPLRESSIPLPSTELAQPEQPAQTKKRPASAKTKKGTATTMKRAPPTKRRKIDPVRSATPLSHTSKPNSKITSGKGTPANSSPAPSTRSQSVDANEDVDDEDDEDEDEDMDDDPDADVYCICRRPDNGTFMIGCDGTCDDWFHGKCVGIAERDKNLIDKYICPDCTKAGVGCTTWKRMCRRHGCRQPARVGKTKGGSSSSKYCSDDCGVLFFRELAARTRGREETVKNRSTRRKSGIAFTEIQAGSSDDLGARGGLLAAGEVKALLNVSKTAEDFHHLGDGVLSPPATPDGKDSSSAFTAAEQQTLAHIHTQKEDARRRHRLLKDRMKFVTMVKQAALRTASEKEVKPKEHCGYDSRLEWTEEQFERWRESPAGQQAFELETLATAEKDDADAMQTDDDDGDEGEVCDRKKCARHLEWAKLAVDDLRFEMSDNGDRMRALDKDETDLRARAGLRAKVGDMAGEGSVEVHHLRAALPSPSTTNGQLGVVETVESAEPMAVEAS